MGSGAQWAPGWLARRLGMSDRRRRAGVGHGGGGTLYAREACRPHLPDQRRPLLSRSRRNRARGPRCDRHRLGPAPALPEVRRPLGLYEPARVRLEATRLEPSWARRPEFVCVPHHRAHAACAFYASGLEAAAILVNDGNGEDESISIYDARFGAPIVQRRGVAPVPLARLHVRRRLPRDRPNVPRGG